MYLLSDRLGLHVEGDVGINPAIVARPACNVSKGLAKAPSKVTEVLCLLKGWLCKRDSLAECNVLRKVTSRSTSAQAGSSEEKALKMPQKLEH